MFINESGRNEQFLLKTFQGGFISNFSSFGKASSEKMFYKWTNQKQVLPVEAMFFNRSWQNMQSLERTFHIFFLPSYISFNKAVSEEKIFFEINKPEQTIACGGHVCYQTGTKWAIFREDLSWMLSTMLLFIWLSSFRGEDFSRNQPIRNNNFLWWPCL